MFAGLSINAYRQGKIGNGDLLVRLVVFVLPLLVLLARAGGAAAGSFDELSFRKGGGHQIIGATVIAVGILYLFAFALAGRDERVAPRPHPPDREPRPGAVPRRPASPSSSPTAWRW